MINNDRKQLGVVSYDESNMSLHQALKGCKGINYPIYDWLIFVLYDNS